MRVRIGAVSLSLCVGVVAGCAVGVDAGGDGLGWPASGPNPDRSEGVAEVGETDSAAGTTEGVDGTASGADEGGEVGGLEESSGGTTGTGTSSSGTTTSADGSTGSSESGSTSSSGSSGSTTGTSTSTSTTTTSTSTSTSTGGTAGMFDDWDDVKCYRNTMGGGGTSCYGRSGTGWTPLSPQCAIDAFGNTYTDTWDPADNTCGAADPSGPYDEIRCFGTGACYGRIGTWWLILIDPCFDKGPDAPPWLGACTPMPTTIDGWESVRCKPILMNSGICYGKLGEAWTFVQPECFAMTLTGWDEVPVAEYCM